MRGDSKLALLIGTMPEAMAELIQDFTAKKDLNARVEIRMRIKAVLDFLSADTIHPPNPMLSKGPKGPVQDAVQAALTGASGGGLGDSTGTAANVSFQTQPGVFGSAYSPIATPVALGPVQPVMDNSEVLG
jgi:hypothetical protein